MGFLVSNIVHVDGINEDRYVVLEPMPFATRDAAYECARQWWADLSGVTVIPVGDKYYVVQSKALA